MTLFIRRYLLLLLVMALFLVVAVMYVNTKDQQATKLQSQEQQITRLETTMDQQLATAKAKQQAAIDDALGTNSGRLATDQSLIREFVKTVATWKNGEEYAEARKSILRRYKIPESSQFMSVYFQEPVSNTDSSGQKIFMIDTEGLNSSLGSIEVTALGVRGTQYKYLVIATMNSTTSNAKTTASNSSAMYLTLDGEGHITDVSGFASVSTPLTSS